MAINLKQYRLMADTIMMCSKYYDTKTLQHCLRVAKYAVENVVVEKKLSELFGASWKMGTRYTCAITVSLDEILWDPAVEPWVDEYHTLPI